MTSHACELRISAPDPVLSFHAGRPLPPLFNWQPGELNSCSAEVQSILTSGGSRVVVPSAATASGAADALSGGGPSSSLG